MNIFISNGVFLTTRTLLHVRNWAPSIFLNIDRLFALLVFFCYWVDLIELFKTSMYTNYRAGDLPKLSILKIQKAKLILANFGVKYFFEEKDENEKMKRLTIEDLPRKMPLKYLTD